MKKAIIITSLAFLLISAGWTIAAQPQGQPFQAIEDAIATLQEQISSIQLIPGPKGDKGDKGDPGDPSWDESRVAALEARISVLENPPLPPTPPTCLAILCENFNLYTNGQLAGHDGWFDRVNGLNYLIQDVVSYEGAKALGNFNSTSDSVLTKIGNSYLDGRQSIWIRTANRNNWTDYSTGGENAQFRLSKGGWDSPQRIVVTFMKNGNVAYNDTSVPWVTFGTYDDNTWNKIDIEWRSSDRSARYRLNDGDWTDWDTFHAGSIFDGFDTVGFGSIQLGSGGVYLDNLH